ncbi:anti-sigma factor domain-containing protein [Bacillus sp. AL-1R]
MNNGIVLKINRSSVVVLTANGEYLKCKKLLSSYSIGEEIQFPNNAIILNKKVKMSFPKLIPVVIASGLILFSFLFVNKNKNEALAAGMVTIDTKAKVSLILDKQLNVIKLKGHNEQGKKVIDKMDNWKNEPIHLVMDELVGEMEKSKVIEPNEKINLNGEMKKEFEHKQSELNHELKDIQESHSHIKKPESKELNQPKIKTQNQHKQEKSSISNSTKVTKGETNYNDKSNLKSPTIAKEKNNNKGHSQEVQNNRHQDGQWGHKQPYSNHRHQVEHHESSNQNQKKQYTNYKKHQDEKKNDYNDDRKLRRTTNEQRKYINNKECYKCNTRYKTNGNENRQINGWQNSSKKRSD